MFEISVACKYLLPRRRQLSVSIISLVSTLVISLVVWLIVVFFSVTEGLEKNWIHKLTALTAPVRITPTEAYYNSYYYQIDSISNASDYSHKTIREKREASVSDPYDPNYDEEIPPYWPAPDRHSDGSLKDLVKLSYAALDALHGVSGLKAQDFELTMSHIHLRLLREAAIPYLPYIRGGSTQSILSYPAYLGNFEPHNSHLNHTLLPVSTQDINNLLNLMGIKEDFAQDEMSTEKTFFTPDILQKRLRNFFQYVKITHLKTHSFGWIIPRFLLPPEIQWTVCAVFKDHTIIRLIVPADRKNITTLKTSLEEQGLTVMIGQVHTQHTQWVLELPGQEARVLSAKIPLILEGDREFPAQLIMSSIDQVKKIEDLQFTINLSIQGTSLQGTIPYQNLEISTAQIGHSLLPETFASPPWIHSFISSHSSQSILPKDADVGDGILLPKSFREAGVFIGDRGYLTYLTPTTSVILEQQLPIYVAGFYDPGIIPIGGKFILANQDVTSLIRASYNQEDKGITNGINIRFDQIRQADDVKAQLAQLFKAQGISRYWNVETYREYEFTKEIMNELQSQKNLFTLIALVIIIVACSNIISMLIILVNDKKIEIGILRSMGATSKSIALIFGLAGGMIGVIGSLVGIGVAILTLHYLQTLIGIISQLQGHQMFSAALYGETLPHELSYEALLFVLIATVIISLLAGIVPAVKACLVRPSSTLKSIGG